MKILRRTNGIDTRAKSGALRGDVCFQLRDAITGKITHEERGHNMLTVGLDNALNKCPMGLNKVDTTYSGINGTAFKVTPIFSQLLGGVLMFPQTLGNDADVLFPAFTNPPTAMASMESYTQSDSRQGAFDSVASHEVTNGFMYQYSWGSAYGNGNIASLGLAPRNAHVWVTDPTKAFQPAFVTNNWINCQGYYKKFDSQQRSAWAMNDRYILVNDLTNATTRSRTIKCYKLGLYGANVMLPYGADAIFATDSYDIDGVTIQGCLWTIADIGVNHANCECQIIGDYAYVIYRNNNTFTVKKITLADGTIASTDTYTFSGASFGGYKACIYNGYIYSGASVSGKIYKCNMANTADITEITNSAFIANENCYGVGSKWIYTTSGMIDGDNDTVVAFSTRIFSDSGNRCFPIYDTGMWLLNMGTNGSAYGIGANLKQWGLMTHYDLESAVTKDSSKSMVLNYTITQV